MKIVEDGKNVRIEGPGRERGRIAYASEKDGRLIFELQPAISQGGEAVQTGVSARGLSHAGGTGESKAT